MKNYIEKIIVHPVGFFLLVFSITLFCLCAFGQDKTGKAEQADSSLSKVKPMCPPCSGCPPCGMGAPSYCCDNKNIPLPVEYRILPKELVESKKLLIK